jgi:hypothetical protein
MKWELFLVIILYLHILLYRHINIRIIYGVYIYIIHDIRMLSNPI